VTRLARGLARGLARVWAAPGTLLGLLLGATTRARPRLRDGLVTFTAPRGFAALHRRLGFAAITLGHVVVANRPLDPVTWAHERAHARQWERLGPLMLLAYPLASLAGYRRNPFERAARRRAGG
jgi:hypothetical protein